MTDELKPVHCGCGGEAYVITNDFEQSFVVCHKCNICTVTYNSKAKAIEAWNTAMGADLRSSDEVLRSERTAKVWQDDWNVWLCENCNEDVAYKDTYCPSCGAKLDWREL